MIRDLNNLPELVLPSGYSIISINEDNGYLWEEVMDSSWGSHPPGAFREVMVANNGYEENRVLVMLDENKNALATSSAWDYGFGEDTWYGDTYQAYPILAFVGVKKEHQGKGYGRVVSTHCLHEFVKRGYKKVHLGVMGTYDGENYPAVKTYLNCGFIPYIVEEWHKDAWKKVFAHLNIPEVEPILRDLSKPYVQTPHPPRPYQLRQAHEAREAGVPYVFGLWEEHNMYKVDSAIYIKLKPLINKTENPDEIIRIIHEEQVENIFIDYPRNPKAMLLMKHDGSHIKIGESPDIRFNQGVEKYLQQRNEMKITCRRYKILTDFSKVYGFLQDTYDPVALNSNLLPQFFEYNQMHTKFDYTKSHRIGIWEDRGKIVAIACFRRMIGKICLLHTDKKYCFLLPELLAWAEQELSIVENNRKSLEIYITDKESDKRELLKSNGFLHMHSDPIKIFDFNNLFIERILPEGFTLIDGIDADYHKLNDCFWMGFSDILDVGPNDDFERQVYLSNAPHYMKTLTTIIVAPDGEYACALGMWFDDKNKYAFLEPLATIPKYRRMGLATVALTEAMKKTKAMGAKYCFGGPNDFYTAIGFDTVCNWELWKKEWEA